LRFTQEFEDGFQGEAAGEPEIENI
jgi:hypothetical protein